MSFKLVIDYREKDLSMLISSTDSENLEIGDVLIKKDDNILFVIERKTVDDLKASIIDGRHREQKARLLNTGIPKERIMYIIEGDITKPTGIPVDTLIGSLINTQLRDGIKTYKTMNIRETAMFIKRLFEKITKEEETLFKECTKTYSSTLKTKKKDNLTPQVWFAHSLASIPQISDKIANEIVKVYPTLQTLTKKYEETKEEERKCVLVDISYPVVNGKTRKVGKVISERVYNFFSGK